MLHLLKFSTTHENALIHANKPVIVEKLRPTSKHGVYGNIANSQIKRASVPTPCLDICFDQIGN